MSAIGYLLSMKNFNSPLIYWKKHLMIIVPFLLFYFYHQQWQLIEKQMKIVFNVS